MTHGQRILGDDDLPDSTYLEVDYQIVGDLLHGVRCGFTEMLVRANDTDILITLMAFVRSFLGVSWSFGLKVDFGIGRTRLLLDIRFMAERYSLNNCRGLLFFHVFT